MYLNSVSLNSTMNGEDGLELAEEIFACGILDSSKKGKKAENSFRRTASDAGDDGWNTDTDIAGLLVAIENCGILDTVEDSVKDNKLPRGRPKKKGIKGAANRESPIFSYIYVDHTLAQAAPKNRHLVQVIQNYCQPPSMSITLATQSYVLQ